MARQRGWGSGTQTRLSSKRRQRGKHAHRSATLATSAGQVSGLIIIPMELNGRQAQASLTIHTILSSKPKCRKGGPHRLSVTICKSFCYDGKGGPRPTREGQSEANGTACSESSDNTKDAASRGQRSASWRSCSISSEVDKRTQVCAMEDAMRSFIHGVV